MLDEEEAREKAAKEQANKELVNSNYMKGELQRLFGLPYEKINVVANGVNTTTYSGVEKDYDFRRQYAADNEKIILFMGRLVYEKGVQHLISAMPKILDNYHDAKLIIAGKCGMLDELKAQVDLMGLSQKVYFTGYLNAKQVSKMYKCADISVFPSTYEPFRNSSIRSNACWNSNSCFRCRWTK